MTRECSPPVVENREPDSGEVPEESKSTYFWAKLLHPADPAAFESVLTGAREVDELVADAGLAAAAWTAETTQLIVDQLSCSSSPDNPVSPAEKRLVEGTVTWTLYRLARAEPVPGYFRRELGQCVRERLANGSTPESWLHALNDLYAVLTERLLHAAATGLPPEQHATAMQEITTTLFHSMSLLGDEITLAFLAERRRQSAGAAAERAKLVHGILDGARVNAERAHRHLGYDLSLHHLGLVLWYDEDTVPWCDDDTRNWTRELETVATGLLREAGCSSTLLVPAGSARLWAWGGRVHGLPAELGELDPTALPGGHVHVAGGLPAEGVAGFRRSYGQAATLEHLSRTVLAGSGNIHDYRTLELFVLMGGDVGRLTEFVRRELGGLADQERPVVTLRETLKCYLDSERSTTATAERLRIAKNTVAYRVKKAEQLRSRPIGQDQLRLHLALHLAERMGPALLSGRGTPKERRPAGRNRGR
ncbi:DNA-binding PucR family transcriptional regulator [Amycolatopsis bartoniae]|uniref:PucR family transcriptional regulator n=1 Tax=Amycolatopsis bartoniae TaxID=941986 RepID=A0A8H9MDC8_9PSEU|nr:helix-turn-helix domain-containing protein [Amycolatopsis bartoniae]MBB2937337.1 DNA-binding PucR family transcriptional regulator [Amycolatopsis bartoniae]GHF78275.1 hypothetical protein GCM10017566_60690 [Amycolatopsis bartoniae]